MLFSLEVIKELKTEQPNHQKHEDANGLNTGTHTVGPTTQSGRPSVGRRAPPAVQVGTECPPTTTELRPVRAKSPRKPRRHGDQTTLLRAIQVKDDPKREARDYPDRHGKESAGTTVSGMLGALGAHTGKEGGPKSRSWDQQTREEQSGRKDITKSQTSRTGRQRRLTRPAGQLPRADKARVRPIKKTVNTHHQCQEFKTRFRTNRTDAKRVRKPHGRIFLKMSLTK